MSTSAGAVMVAPIVALGMMQAVAVAVVVTQVSIEVARFFCSHRAAVAAVARVKLEPAVMAARAVAALA